MKYLRNASIFSCAFFASYLTLQAETIDLDLTKTVAASTDLNQDISNPAIYTYQSKPYTGTLNSETNINLNYTFPDGTLSGTPIAKVLSSFTAKNLTYNLTLPKGFWSNTLMTINSSVNVELESFNVNLIDAVMHPGLSITTNSNATFTTSGNFTMTDSRTYADWFMTRMTFTGSGTVKIGGNLVMIAKGSKVTANELDAVFLNTQTANFTVGGIVNLENQTKVSANNIWRMTSDVKGTYTRTIGGLDVSSKGSLQLVASSANKNITNLVFTNSTKSEYVGGLTTRSETVEEVTTLSDNKLNLTMKATDAVNGRQIMRFISVADWSLDNIKLSNAKTALNEVTVQKGRLDIAMYDGMKADTLAMSGGTFSAIGASSEIGTVNFDYMTFSGGKIHSDLSEADGNDIVKVSNQITKIGTSDKLTFEIGVSAQDLSSWLEASELNSWDVTLLTFTTTGSNVSESDMLLELQNGVFGKISFSEAGGVTSVIANLTTVPEPATIAAIIGILSLALASYRRRR